MFIARGEVSFFFFFPVAVKFLARSLATFLSTERENRRIENRQLPPSGEVLTNFKCSIPELCGENSTCKLELFSEEIVENTYDKTKEARKRPKSGTKVRTVC